MTQSDPRTLSRILDANLNRAREGLRVVEDILRFGYDEEPLSGQVKSLRHQITDLSRLLETEGFDLLRDRKVESDIGRDRPSPSNDPGDDAKIAANWSRVQEALRVIEEGLRACFPQSARQASSLRYEAYRLEPITRGYLDRGRMLNNTTLMVLVSGPTAPQDAARAFKEGADLVQLREKEVDDRTLLERAREIVQIAHQHQKLCLINDRPDIALLSQADGYHLGQHDLPLREVRSLLGPRSLLGISVHNTTELEKALLEFPDYLGVGTLFPSSTRPDLIPSGPEFLLEVSRTTSIPHFAIGGINMDNIDTLRDQGIHGIAISQAAHQTPQIRQILDAWTF